VGSSIDGREESADWVSAEACWNRYYLLTEIKIKAMRDIVLLACGECKRRNYSTTKNKKLTTARLEFKKYCRFCRKHTPHKETK